jgi:hypothetical protein
VGENSELSVLNLAEHIVDLITGVLKVKGCHYLCLLIREAHEVVEVKIGLEMQTVRINLREVKCWHHL